MDITLLGTGCPVVSTERYGPAQLIRHGGTKVLVDCGSGVTQRLVAAGCTGRDIDALLLTHFVPPSCDRAALLDEVAADFPGPVAIGEDLMSFDAATGRLRYGAATLALGRPGPRTP